MTRQPRQKVWHFRFNDGLQEFITDETEAYNLIQVLDEHETVDVFVLEPKEDPTRLLIAELDRLQTPIITSEMDGVLDKYRK